MREFKTGLKPPIDIKGEVSQMENKLLGKTDQDSGLQFKSASAGIFLAPPNPIATHCAMVLSPKGAMLFLMPSRFYLKIKIPIIR